MFIVITIYFNYIYMNYLLNEGYNLKSNKYIQSGKNQFISINNKSYLDLSCCAGSQILGHQNNVFKQSLKKIVKNNFMNSAGANVHAKNFSHLLKKTFPNYSKFILCNSGTEAVSKGIRICRALTGNKKIIEISGSWHGSVDETLYFKKENKVKSISDGLYSSSNDIILAPYNNIDETKKIINKNKKKICCVLIEPIPASLPLKDGEKYLKKLYKYCKANRVILLFDEMITGIRSNGKSVQQILNIKPDISTFGKCFGGSMPIGIISVSNAIENKMKKKKIFFGGTFSGNYICLSIANDTVTYILKNKKKIFSKIEMLTKMLC